MKAKELQDIVLRKRQNHKTPTQIFHELDEKISLAAIKRWVKMIDKHGSIDLRTPPGRNRSARTEENVRKTKRLLKGKKKVTVRIVKKNWEFQLVQLIRY